jgi:hypothetical protein
VDGVTTSKADEKIIEEAKKRFERCKTWESAAQARFVEDIKFAEGDSDNGWQWDDLIRQTRTKAQGGPRPCLTINKVRQQNLQIINDQRENKAQIEVRPTADGATYEAAKVYEGICRHIEYQSNAMAAYDTASWFQIYGGIGYWRVLTDYADPTSFDQEIFIRRVPDPRSVYLDPDIQQFDGSDARFGFIFRDVPRDEFDNEYPEWKDEVGGDAISGDDGPTLGATDDWSDKDHVRVAEYYRKTDKEDRLILLQDSEGTRKVLKSEMPEGLYDRLKGTPFILNERPTYQAKVEWFKIAGSHIIDRQEWPGSYIPIVRVVGEETVIDGQLDRKGHTRASKDPQRTYNWQSSAMVETLALQTKAPFFGPIQAFEGLETQYFNANQENPPFLTYNQYDDNGRPLEKPERIVPGQLGPAIVQSLTIAQQELMMASGQYQSQFGENENAKSGIAIQQRQRQGDKATYHYIDHFAQAIRFTGRILIDLIPKIYDTPRIIKIMGEDGSQTEVNLKPDGPIYQQMVQGQPADQSQVKAAQNDPKLKDTIETIFNPNVGKYDVIADIGPAYATRRQETFNALSQMMAQNQELVKIAGDLLFRAADFPMADEVAERFQRAIPANILGQAPPPEMQELQQQNQALHNIIQTLSQKLGEAQSKAKQGVDKGEIEAYKAETERQAVIAGVDPMLAKMIYRSKASQVMDMPVVPIMAEHAAADQAMMPQPMPQEQTETVQ